MSAATTTPTVPVLAETVGGDGRRMLKAGEVYAVHHPAGQYRSECWSIVQLGLPTAEVRSEEAARAWLTFLAAAQAEGRS